MVLDLHEIDRDGTVFDGAVEIPALEGPGGESVRISRATTSGEVRRGDQGHDLFGRFRAVADLTCSRCLEVFPAELSDEFYLTLVPKIEPADEADHEVTSDEAALYAVPGGRLDLRDVIAEQIYLAIPLKPVCRSECRGLCPECGTNRNVSECACRPASPETGRSALASLKERRPNS